MCYVYEEHNIGFFMDIAGDEKRYLQILLNFLSNALKFTKPEGNIKVELKLIDSQNMAPKESISLLHS